MHEDPQWLVLSVRKECTQIYDSRLPNCIVEVFIQKHLNYRGVIKSKNIQDLDMMIVKAKLYGKQNNKMKQQYQLIGANSKTI